MAWRQVILLPALLALASCAGAPPVGERGAGLGPAVDKACDILVADGEPGKAETEDETFYLRRALQVMSEARGGLSVTCVKERVPAKFECKLLVLANVSTLGKQGAELIARHVGKGGGLLIFCGGRMDIEQYNKLLGGEGRAVLPCKFVRRIEPAAGKDAAERMFDMKSWKLVEKLGGGEFGGVKVKGLVQVEAAKNATVLVAYDDGAAAVVAANCGGGKSVVVTTSCDSEWTNLPLHPLYVVLVSELMDYFNVGKTSAPGAWDKL